MSRLSERERSLVGLGAALASNCVPCIESHIPRARRAGCGEAEIRQAVQIADKVRQVPARLVLQAAMARVQEDPAEGAAPVAAGCGCAKPNESGRVS